MPFLIFSLFHLSARLFHLSARLRCRRASPTSPQLPSLSEIVQSNHVVADDLPFFVFRDAREISRYNLLGMRPGGHRMWVVGRPHYVVDSYLMTILDAERIVDKRGAHLPVEILTWSELQRSRVHVPIFFERMIPALDNEWQPAYFVLRRYQSQARKSLEHP